MAARLLASTTALLVAVSASVDKIVAHFSSARNLVQKAQLGDSRISPDVGYLVLNTLCPALRALVSDGLKPFQKDVITGQRPSSAWSVVEASAKPGPSTRSLNALYWRVSRLAPLRNNQQRFHAFILGLLNMKQMEQWFSHLQQNSELISALYLPTAFLVLSQGVCHRWSEELLLLLQPLSMLTFQLDLLFEHHHLALEVRPTVPRQAAAPPGGAKEPALSLHAAETDSSGFSLVSFPKLAGGLFEQRSPMDGAWPGATLPQRLLQWGDRLTHAWVGGEGCLRPEPNPEPSQTEPEEKPVGWWQQLSQASGVYVHHPAASPVSKPEGFPYACWAKLRAAMGEALKEASPWMGETSPGANARPQGPGPGEQPAPVSSSQRSRGDKTKVPTAGDHCNGDARAAEENPDARKAPEAGRGSG
ncbi:hypothetical protein JRQ81_009373 [Phrynocephalus forsythii]|uniref:RUN domain-containing protein n=1 Tax=Phrynocephalus forsythii TaxID=171643 RepID=A0A9Q0XA23_9SAUR|nr:hypothetical protein JRQ81_009373 [Phrynocephalus forsythii]